MAGCYWRSIPSVPTIALVERPTDGFAISLRRASVEETVEEIADELELALREARGRSRPFVLGLATGRTMEPLWNCLAARHAAGRLSFGRVWAFALDEYCGLPLGHPGRMRSELERGLLAHIDLPPEQLRLPDVDSEGGVEARSDAHERAIRAAGGIDLQLLGVGSNGHVAFNEPGSSPDSRTRRVHLASATREAASARFGSLEAVPRAALTAGIATIREARVLRILAFGATKAEAVRAAVSGTCDPSRPVTLLTGHADARLHADDAACEAL